MKQLFSGSSKKQVSSQRFLFICTIEEEQELMEILKIYSPSQIITRIEPEKIHSNFYNEHAFDEIIFVAGKLSWSDIINQVILLSNKTIFRFHATGSNSIISSYSKKSNGEVFTKHELYGLTTTDQPG